MAENRITVVLGAGAALELAPDGCERPTTENITRDIIHNKPITWDVDSKCDKEVNLIWNIYEHLCKSYHTCPAGGLDPNEPSSAGKVHFEIIFHIIEMLDTYDRSWRKETHHKNVAPFSSFIVSDFKHNSNELFPASRHLLEKIIDRVIEYDSKFYEAKNDWYRVFWNGRGKSWDVFNFNYDTTIEQSLIAYEDGYEEISNEDVFKRFNINKLLKNIDEFSTVNHIHGCILYGNDRYKDANQDVYDFEQHDMYKWPDAETAKKMWLGKTSSNEYAQNGQTIIQGPIITGLSKTEKITCLPYDIYRYNLLRAIQKNNGMLVAGYSFGDKYANYALNRLSQCHGDDKRVVLIDYWDIQGYCTKEGFDINAEKDALSPLIFEHYFELDYGNEEALMFIKRIAHHDCSIWKHFNRLSLTGPMVSDNGQLMLFIGGMKEAISNHKNEIYKFLGI